MKESCGEWDNRLGTFREKKMKSAKEKPEPPFWSGSVWYTHEKGFVIRHQNEGEIEGKEDPLFCWRPGIDSPD